MHNVTLCIRVMAGDPPLIHYCWNRQVREEMKSRFNIDYILTCNCRHGKTLIEKVWYATCTVVNTGTILFSHSCCCSILVGALLLEIINFTWLASLLETSQNSHLRLGTVGISFEVRGVGVGLFFLDIFRQFRLHVHALLLFYPYM